MKLDYFFDTMLLLDFQFQMITGIIGLKMLLKKKEIIIGLQQ